MRLLRDPGQHGGKNEYFPEEELRVNSSDTSAPPRTLGLRNKNMAIFIEHRDAIVLLTTIGFSVFLYAHPISSIPVAMPRDSSMKTFETSRAENVRGKNISFRARNCWKIAEIVEFNRELC